MAECPELEPEYNTQARRKSRKAGLRISLRGCKAPNLKAESEGLKQRTSRVAISLSLSVEKMRGEVRNKGNVQHGLCELRLQMDTPTLCPQVAGGPNLKTKAKQRITE